ncbi:P-loop containing nucleoside triphosphate hydrolase protein [Hypoxylon sp. FL0543]|nr:P-loop containing nucleoside triphosphate hydrolase protein [Hypoxylon sp. FL0543]
MVGRGRDCEIQWVYAKSKHPKSVLGFDEEDEGISYALRAEVKYDEKGMPTYTTLEVNSPHLLKIFKSIVGRYPTLATDFESPFEMQSPYPFLYHYWDEIHAAYNQEGLSDDARMHLKLLLKFMRKKMALDRERIQSMLKASSIEFSTLWAIFRPGDLVYSSVDGHSRILRLESLAYEENKTIGKFAQIGCSYVDYDGVQFGRATHGFKILQKLSFPAEQPCQVTSLPVFPTSYLNGINKIKQQLVERGGRFLRIHGVQVKNYRGLARYLKDRPGNWYDPNENESPGSWLPYTESGRVVLDTRTFVEENRLDAHAVGTCNVDDDLARMLMPPFSYGYSLALKIWCRFYIDSFLDIEWDKSALDEIMVKDDRKQVLGALVLSHISPDDPRDIMKHKGKGLVVLLHGSPGSGKTSTAECVAEAAERPLITSTIGELNQDNSSYYFERRLTRLLQYATTWKAVVLLDEADVFLEARSDNQGGATEHNALVATFLKRLEYFSGIMFLTTNRVRVFDEAMLSRVHLALEYEAPGSEMRRLIWTRNLAMIPRSELDFDLDRELDEMLVADFNGREIANCVNTAKTLARFQKSKLRAEHIWQVLNARKVFRDRIDDMKTEDLQAMSALGEECQPEPKDQGTFWGTLAGFWPWKMLQTNHQVNGLVEG